MKVHFFIISPRHKRGDAGALSLPIQPLSPVKQRHARVAASPLYFTFFFGGGGFFVPGLSVLSNDSSPKRPEKREIGDGLDDVIYGATKKPWGIVD